MNAVARIIWFSAAAGWLLFRAARLTEYTRRFQGAAGRWLPVPVIFARARSTAAGPVAARCGMVR
jgi:hypothetical protein